MYSFRSSHLHISLPFLCSLPHRHLYLASFYLFYHLPSASPFMGSPVVDLLPSSRFTSHYTSFLASFSLHNSPPSPLSKLHGSLPLSSLTGSTSFSAPSVTFTYPSPLAFQLSIRVRLTQLTSLALLEPLDFRPFGFSPLFSLLMSTFLLLIAITSTLGFLLISPILRYHSTEHSTTYTSFLAYRRFGHHLSLFYLWCNPSPIVRCYAFIIRMAASMPTAYVSSTSHSLPHFNGVRDLIVLSGLSPS